MKIASVIKKLKKIFIVIYGTLQHLVYNLKKLKYFTTDIWQKVVARKTTRINFRTKFN